VTPLVVVIAILYMPWEPITSARDWYAPAIDIIQAEPTMEDIERDLRKRYRIMQIEECNE
jgi:hypothetical protein